MIHATVNRFHLGDGLISLHLLRALAKQHPNDVFLHFGHAHLLGELNDAVSDIPNIQLFSFESVQWKENEHRAIDTWKNAEGFWEKSPVRWDWSAFTLTHHQWTADRMGLISPFTCREHLLFDYPALEDKQKDCGVKWDFLFFNSEPCSGQFTGMAEHGIGYMDDFMRRIAAEGHSIITTMPFEDFPCTRTTLACIGQISQRCFHHIGVCTGPFWPTMNVHNHHDNRDKEGRVRLVLIDNSEKLNMPFIHQADSIGVVEEIAKQAGWL